MGIKKNTNNQTDNSSQNSAPKIYPKYHKIEQIREIGEIQRDFLHNLFKTIQIIKLFALQSKKKRRRPLVFFLYFFFFINYYYY